MNNVDLIRKKKNHDEAREFCIESLERWGWKEINNNSVPLNVTKTWNFGYYRVIGDEKFKIYTLQEWVE